MKKHILIVEDEEHLADALSHNLQFEGYATTHAPDGEEGLKLAQTIQFDLVILDIMMPKLDGLEVCRRLRASGNKVPEDIAAFHPINLRRTQLNDNDAGGRVPYANFTKKTGMLEKIRHYSPETYRRLMRLDRDFATQGELYAYVRDTFGLSEAQFRQVVTNTQKAAEIVRNTCRSGKLRFDLDPLAFLVAGDAQEQKIDCDSP